MSHLRLHPEQHLVNRIGCLRAAVLGANDGILSTASLDLSAPPCGSRKTLFELELPGSIVASTNARMKCFSSIA